MSEVVLVPVTIKTPFGEYVMDTDMHCSGDYYMPGGKAQEVDFVPPQQPNHALKWKLTIHWDEAC